MGEIDYTPIIDNMVWSYSRIKSFEMCPYRFYLKYIWPKLPENLGKRLEPKHMFSSSYGSFVHKLLEHYFKNEMTQRELIRSYLRDFKTEVKARAPNPKIFKSYFDSGLQYLKEITPLPYDMVAVEKEVNFKLDGIPFVGYIDFLGKKNKELFVVDNKSRMLKPRSQRPKPTKSDMELDSYLKQLYIYSYAVEEEYGTLPKALCFNCFRSNMLIVEPFSIEAYSDSKRWLMDSIGEIRKEKEFKPAIEYFQCTHLCEMQDDCEYFDLTKKKR